MLADLWGPTMAALHLPCWLLRVLPRGVLYRLLMLLKGRRERRLRRLERRAERVERERRLAALGADIVAGAIELLGEVRRGR